MEIKNIWPKKDDLDKDKIKEGEETFVKLMQRALEGKQSDFMFIKCWEERTLAKDYIVVAETVVELFKRLESNATKIYVNQIMAGEQELETVISLKQLYICKKFYEQEIAIAEDMLAEYRSYIWGGHVWDTLVGNIRKEEDMVDYRTLPIKWF